MNHPPDDDEPAAWMTMAAAVEFLTRVSIPSMRQLTSSQYARAQRQSVIYFPLVGGLVGAFTAAVFLVLLEGFSPWIAALIAIGCEVWITGAFHEDAMADACDALGGGRTREQVLLILKDSRLGAYGTLGLGLGMGLRVACFAELAVTGAWWSFASILAAATLGRLAIVGVMVTTPPIVDRDSQARDIGERQTIESLKLATLYSLPLWGGWLLLHPLQSLATVIACLVLLHWYRKLILRRVAGTTGDLLGCSAFITQAAVLVGSCWGGEAA